MPEPPKPHRVLVSGATGLIGRHLIAFLRARGVQVVPLVRRPLAEPCLLWDEVHGDNGPAAVSGFDTIVHLAGEPVSSGRWTAARKRAILESRVRSTRALASAAARAATPPRAFLCASGINAYGDRGDTVVEESQPYGTGFLAEVCAAWEAATEPLEQKARVVHLRIGVVLATDGGTLPLLLPLFRLGLGGPIGGGRAYLSWITLEDLLRGTLHLMQHSEQSGPVNLVAPDPVPNRIFSQALARALHRPALLPAPGWAVRLLFGQMADETVLASVRAVPQRLLADGFVFQDAAIGPALERILSTRSRSRRRSPGSQSA